MRRYVEAAQAAGLNRDGSEDQLTDELLAAVVEAVRPARPDGGQDRRHAHPPGSGVAYRTLHRLCVQRCEYRRAATTVRVADGDPGGEVEIDFGRSDLIDDPETGRRRVVKGLIFTAVLSRHMFVWLTHSETTQAVIDGCEAAWAFFDGVFRVVIPDNLSAVVTDAT